MAHEYGRDWRIKISDGGSPAVFDAIGGEGSWSKKASSDKIDLSSKDDAQIKAMGWGQQEITFSVAGKLKLPDPGFEQLYAVSNVSPPEVEMQLVKNGVIKWQGKVGVSGVSMDGSNNQAVTYSVDMTAVEAPSIDDLTA